MFFHQKELIQPVKVGKPDARFGTFLLEQFGGATGELTAALQYWVQSFHVENAGIRDMLQDIALEEFGHLEMVGKLIAQHTSKVDQTAVYDAPLFKLKGGGPHFIDSQGSGSASSRARGPCSDGNGLDIGAAARSADKCGALGAARQPFRNGASGPLKVTADFVVALAASSSMSAAGAC
jgi:Manganese containing catalase